MNYNSVDLLHKLGDEFKALKLPFSVKVLERIEMPSLILPHPYFVMLIQINTEISEELWHNLRHLGKCEEIRREPMVNLEEIRESTAGYFQSEEDAFNFTMSLDIEHVKIYRLSIDIQLEDWKVDGFIAELRHATKDYRLKIYEEEFDKEVDNHLIEGEYNKENDGYK